MTKLKAVFLGTQAQSILHLSRSTKEFEEAMKRQRACRVLAEVHSGFQIAVRYGFHLSLS